MTSPTEFRRLAIGRVVRKDELEYYRELSDGGWLDLAARKLGAAADVTDGTA